MLRFLGRSTASEARSDGSSPTEVCSGGDEGLMAWELVNAAYSDEDDVYSYDSDETVTTVDDLELNEDDEGGDAEVDKDAPAVREFVSPCDIIAIQAMSVSPPMSFPVEMSVNCSAQDYSDDDDDDGEDDYDVDEELVPWKLKGRFVKQRITKMGIRKMGQKGGPKLKAKKVPYYDNRPGLYGKLR